MGLRMIECLNIVNKTNIDLILKSHKISDFIGLNSRQWFTLSFPLASIS